LNFSQFVGFQDSPNLSKNQKVAETCEFDGKEPLFVERTIAISKKSFNIVSLQFSRASVKISREISDEMHFNAGRRLSTHA